MEMTNAQLARTEKMMVEYAKGLPVRIEMISGCLYVFASELACLRIFAKYNTNGKHYNPKAILGYSENLNSHYFCLEN